MHRLREKTWLFTMAAAAGTVLIVLVAAGLLLRNISLFLWFDARFSQIFAQIRGATLQQPILLLLILAYLGSLGLVRLWREKHRLPAAILWAALLVVLIAAAILLTRVNGIRFADVLLSLLELLKQGGL